MIGPRQILTIEVLRLLEKAILKLGFANNRAILLAEFTESVLDILSYPEFTMGPPYLDP